jgi:hypothetical protein
MFGYWYVQYKPAPFAWGAVDLDSAADELQPFSDTEQPETSTRLACLRQHFWIETYPLIGYDQMQQTFGRPQTDPDGLGFGMFYCIEQQFANRLEQQGVRGFVQGLNGIHFQIHVKVLFIGHPRSEPFQAGIQSVFVQDGRAQFSGQRSRGCNRFIDQLFYFPRSLFNPASFISAENCHTVLGRNKQLLDMVVQNLCQSLTFTLFA